MSKVAPNHRRKECINITKNGSRAIATQNPVLIIFVDHQNEWMEIFMIIAGGVAAVYALSTRDLLRQRGTTFDREINVSLRFE